MDSSSASSYWDESDWPVPIDYDKDTQRGFTDLHTNDCPFCFCLTKAEHKSRSMTKFQLAKVRRLIFHEECHFCSSLEGTQITLCDFCKHLRFGHLLRCIWRSGLLTELFIALNPKDRALNRTKCDLCDFLTNAMSLPQTGPSEVEIIPAASATLRIGSWNFRDFVRYMEVRGRRGDPTLTFSIFLKVDDHQANIWVHSEQFVQWDVIHLWLSECKGSHKRLCAIRSRLTLPPGFRLIDVNKRCVIEREGFCEYVALSYVWGNRSESACYVEQATCDNIESLKVPGGLTQLPETIEDAIVICQKLGIQYLWVDRYCIVQDHAVHKHTQIGAMANIYSSSTLTIIACSGTDGVESGIPGVRRKRQKRSCVNIRDLALSYKSPHLDEIVSRSIWNTRGWTYQEAVLSERKLIMFPTEAWFECRKGTFREHGSYRSNLESTVWSTQLRAYPHIDSTEFEDYGPKVTMYTTRKLGYASDVYNAFAGIGQALYARHGGFHFGLPEPHFDEALLWYCGCRWTESNSRCLRHCAELTPSWSWGSVTCGVLYEGTFCISLVKWVLYKAQFAEMSSGSANSETCKAQCIELKATGEPVPWRRWGFERKGPCPQFFLALAINEGCITAGKTVISEHESFSSLKEDFTCRWPTYMDAYEDVQQTGTRPSSGSNGVLFTNAQSAIFNIQSGWIRNPDGLVVGGMCQAGLPKIIGHDGQKIHKESSDSGKSRDYEECSNYEECYDDEECCVEGIALSISETHGIHRAVELNNPDISLGDSWMKDQRRELLRDLTYFDRNGNPLFPVPKVNVMFIRRQKDGYARRIGLGWIALKQWSSLKWTLKEIWLK